MIQEVQKRDSSQKCERNTEGTSYSVSTHASTFRPLLMYTVSTSTDKDSKFSLNLQPSVSNYVAD